MIMLVLLYFMYKRGEDFTLGKSGFMTGAVDLVSSYRIIVIHLVQIYYWHKMKRSRAAKTQNISLSQNTEDHFKAMNAIWN
ncbi:unnamed protein product [Heligmosomoides polygyrus]|uniref:7TM_GPCR_Srx domain-containing protein n=1 Tax=Heligmosomoides polygyrus TaxID=6339 RepID=A0A183F2F4_HELPZ|nr:unnamed protein product [Heligmosomoides polygyrus]